MGWITTAQNLTLPAGALGLLLWGLVAFIKALPQLKRIQMEGDASLRGDLLEMVKDLRAELNDERVNCAVKIQALEADNERLHGQIHELRNQMMELVAKQRLGGN